MNQSAFEPNTTQVPNFIFEMIPRLSEAELKVLMVIAACGAWANHELRKTHLVIEIGPNRWAVVNPRAMGERQ